MRCPIPIRVRQGNRPIPGGAASRSIPRRAFRARPTRPPRPPFRSQASSAPLHRSISASATAPSAIPAPPSGRCGGSSCTTRISPSRRVASTPSSSGPSCAASLRLAPGRRPIRSSRRSRRSPPTSKPSSVPEPRSRTPPTGRSTSATILPTAQATCTSISIRSGRLPQSTPSPSTAIGRSPTGATATISIARPACVPPTISTT